MKTLERAENVFGKLSEKCKQRIKDYLNDPTYDKWDDISSIIITSDLKTIWQAVIDIDPTFPKKGRVTDINGNIIKEWDKIPEPYIVLRAIHNAI